MRTELGDHVWRFEVHDRTHSEKGQHPHFVCVTCGSVTCWRMTGLPLSSCLAYSAVDRLKLRAV